MRIPCARFTEKHARHPDGRVHSTILYSAPTHFARVPNAEVRPGACRPLRARRAREEADTGERQHHEGTGDIDEHPADAAMCTPDAKALGATPPRAPEQHGHTGDHQMFCRSISAHRSAMRFSTRHSPCPPARNDGRRTAADTPRTAAGSSTRHVDLLDAAGFSANVLAGPRPKAVPPWTDTATVPTSTRHSTTSTVVDGAS